MAIKDRIAPQPKRFATLPCEILTTFFEYTDISRGSVTVASVFGMRWDDYFIANLPPSCPVKEFDEVTKLSGLFFYQPVDRGLGAKRLDKRRDRSVSNLIEMFKIINANCGIGDGVGLLTEFDEGGRSSGGGLFRGVTLETLLSQVSLPSPSLPSHPLPSLPSGPIPSLPLPSSPIPSPPLPLELGPLNLARGFRECCNLPQRGLGRSPSRNRIWSF